MQGERPLKALEQCEEELRKLAAQAAAEGDYDMLARLGSTARAISEIARDWQSGRAGSDSTVGAGRTPASQSGGQSPPHPTTSRRTSRAAVSRGYPRFVRRGDELVKIGWSRSDRREYQHRAARGVLVALCQVLLESSKRRKLFTMDALERQLGDGDDAAPGYQGYAWLAWLRSAGFVKQHGRQGYSLVKPASFEKDVERAFASVPVQEPQQ